MSNVPSEILSMVRQAEETLNMLIVRAFENGYDIRVVQPESAQPVRLDVRRI